MLDPEQVQALAIIMVGAFLMVLATAVFYVFAFRPRLKESEPLLALGMLDDDLRTELLAQRTAVEQLNAALVRHADRLEHAISPDSPVVELHAKLTDQAQMTDALLRQIKQHSDHITGLGENEHQLINLIQAQSDQLALIIYRLDEAARSRVQDEIARDDAFTSRLDEHARLLAELDTELSAQMNTVRGIDTRTNVQANLLQTAVEERRHQTTITERIWDQVSQIMPLLNRVLNTLPSPQQRHLMDIKGIGPAYSKMLLEAGITTFEELAAKTPDDILNLIDAPEWRKQSIDVGDWIYQAKKFAEQTKKGEQ